MAHENPVTRMAGIADEVSRGEGGAPEFAVSSEDGISTLARSFTRMRRNLEKAVSMVKSTRTVSG